jgi:FkbM family methyltransferase
MTELELHQLKVGDRTLEMYLYPSPEVYSDCLRGVNGGSHIADFFLKRRGFYSGCGINIGANIGSVLLPLAMKMPFVIGFEPDPTNFKLLNASVTHNCMQNVHLINKAVSDFNGQSTFYRHPSNSGEHTLFNEYYGTNKSLLTEIQIDVITIDSFLSELELNVTLIAMDVQGCELKILRGLSPYLERSTIRPAILMEFSPSHFEAAGDHCEDISEFCERHQYDPSLTNGGGDFTKIRPSTLAAIYDDFLPTRTHLENIALIPRELF